MRKHTAQTNQQPIPTKELEKTCLTAAEAGARKATAYFNKTLKVNYKGKEKHGGTIVTEADVAAEKEARKIISRKYPGHSIVGEENGGKAQGGYVWFIDPVDGTGNFSRGMPIWGTLVAVALDAKPVAGAMVFPVLRRKFYASKGNGAFADGKKIRCSNKTADQGFTLGQSLHRTQSVENALDCMREFSGSIGGVRIFGCTGYEGALIAEGKAELKIRFHTNAWDSCAPAIITREAGGIYRNFKGKEWTTKDDTAISAANEKASTQAFRRLKHLFHVRGTPLRQ